jgi:hypothetical protein
MNLKKPTLKMEVFFSKSWYLPMSPLGITTAEKNITNKISVLCIHRPLYIIRNRTNNDCNTRSNWEGNGLFYIHTHKTVNGINIVR